MTEMSALVDAGAVAFSDDGKTIMDGGVMRRVLEYSRLVERSGDRPLRGPHAGRRRRRERGAGLDAPRPARQPGRGRGRADRARSAARRGDGRAPARGPRLDRGRRRHDPAGPRARHLRHRRGDAASSDAHRRGDARLRHQRQGRAAAARRRPIARPAAKASPTAPSTRSRPTTRPTPSHEKDLEFTLAPPGMIGFETALAVVLELVREGELTPLELMRRLSTNPARILRRPGGSLAPGSPGDVVVIDPERRWTYDPAKGFSKSRNSPWAGADARRARVRSPSWPASSSMTSSAAWWRLERAPAARAPGARRRHRLPRDRLRRERASASARCVSTPA